MNLLRPFLKLHKLRKISFSQVIDLLRAQAALVSATRAVKKKPLGELVAVTETAAGPVDDEGRLRSQRIAWSVVQAAKHGALPATCLVRSVAIQHLLLRENLPPGEIRVGVKWDDGGFFAHAWVEQDERILGDTRQHVGQFDPVTDMRLVQF